MRLLAVCVAVLVGICAIAVVGYDIGGAVLGCFVVGIIAATTCVVQAYTMRRSAIKNKSVRKRISSNTGRTVVGGTRGDGGAADAVGDAGTVDSAVGDAGGDDDGDGAESADDGSDGADSADVGTGTGSELSQENIYGKMCSLHTLVNTYINKLNRDKINKKFISTAESELADIVTIAKNWKGGITERVRKNYVALQEQAMSIPVDDPFNLFSDNDPITTRVYGLYGAMTDAQPGCCCACICGIFKILKCACKYIKK